MTRRIGLPAVLSFLGVLASGTSNLCLAQCPDGTPPPCGPQRAAPAPAPTSVAVLYFENLTRDSADQYLVDGLTEEIILRLQQLARLEVKSRYESQRVRTQHGAAPAVLGRSLNVRYLVNGSVQRSRERIVVRVELTRAERGVGIWSERFDRTSGDVLDVIDAVARGIATGVAGRLLPAEAASIARRPTADAVAYEELLRGNFYLAQRSAASLARAAEAYERAAARDPQLKSALARLALVYSLGEIYGVGTLPPESVTARSERSTRRAVAEAPELSDAWLARGFQQVVRALVSAAPVADALASLERSLALDSMSPEAHHQYAGALTLLWRDSLAEVEYRRAIALEPGRAVSLQELAMLYLRTGRFRDALLVADSAVAADPRLTRAHEMRAVALLGVGDTGGALAAAEHAVAVETGQLAVEAQSFLAVVRVALGDTARARQFVGSAPRTDTFAWVTLAAAALGDSALTLSLLQGLSSLTRRCVLVRWPQVAALRGYPPLDTLRAECRAVQGAAR